MINFSISISDVISLIGILVSLLISVVTLLYNAKLIKDSLKPDIQIYMDYLASNSMQYLVIKNFGKTSTTIKNLTHNFPSKHYVTEFLATAKYIHLAQNQIFYIPFSSRELKKDFKINEVIFEFQYTFNNKKIKTKKCVNLYPSTLDERPDYTIEKALNRLVSTLELNLMK